MNTLLENIRASAILMKNLPSTLSGDALLISREEARRIGYELEACAERMEQKVAQHDWRQRDETEHSCAICGADSDGLPRPCVPALPQGVEEWMPILGTCLAIPMKLLDESQAKSNHGQTPARLKERGGISLSEAVAIAGKMKWRSLESKRALEILHDLSGMAIVPVEPTRAMCKAATSYTHSHDAMLIYKAMLAAAKEKGE